MILAGISMMRNEEDLAWWVASHMAAECDFVLVADHHSSDRTRELLESAGAEVRDAETERYDQAGVMMRLAQEAERRGADWIIPFDADEWWYADGRPMRTALAEVTGFQTRAVTYDMIPQADDNADPNPFLRVRRFRPWTSSRPENRKIAFRPNRDRRLMQGNHGLLDKPLAPEGPLRIRHVPYRTFSQAANKLRQGKAVLEASDLPAGWGWHWRSWGALDNEELHRWWMDWTDPRGLVEL